LSLPAALPIWVAVGLPDRLADGDALADRQGRERQVCRLLSRSHRLSSVRGLAPPRSPRPARPAVAAPARVPPRIRRTADACQRPGDAARAARAPLSRGGCRASPAA